MSDYIKLSRRSAEVLLKSNEKTWQADGGLALCELRASLSAPSPLATTLTAIESEMARGRPGGCAHGGAAGEAKAEVQAMGRFVTVKLRVARDEAGALLADEMPSMEAGSIWMRFRASLESALRPRRRTPHPATSLGREDAKSRRTSKREETSAIWEGCWQRCGGKCECGCGQTLAPRGLSGFTNSKPTLDHFFGKARVKQAVQNCWMLRWDCHLEGKTQNKDGARIWHEKFITHCERYSYAAEAERARKRLEGIISVRERETQLRASEEGRG